MAFAFSGEKANVTTGGALPVFLHIYWHLWVAFAFLEKANVALCLVVWTHICHLRVVYAVSGTPGTWNQPNFWNLWPLVQLEIFLYGICLHLLHLPHLLFIPTLYLTERNRAKGAPMDGQTTDDGRASGHRTVQISLSLSHVAVSPKIRHLFPLPSVLGCS